MQAMAKTQNNKHTKKTNINEPAGQRQQQTDGEDPKLPSNFLDTNDCKQTNNIQWYPETCEKV